MTPAFLSLTKNRTEGKLSQIKNDDGSDFLTEKERHKHIFDTYEKLYKNQDQQNLPDDLVQSFLGPDVLNSDLVQNSILTADESAWLDRPLSMAELDMSVKKR
jgi:hypothetical protein